MKNNYIVQSKNPVTESEGGYVAWELLVVGLGITSARSTRLWADNRWKDSSLCLAGEGGGGSV